jgi:hypothetical protein
MSELTTHSGTSENDILSRISAARGKVDAEPVKEPTEEAEPVELSDESDVEEPMESKELESIDESEVDEVEESEVEELETQPDNDDLFYIDLDGEEITSEQIREWKQGSMRQSDYTRKTTELANERKEFDAEKQSFEQLKSKLSEQAATLEVLLSEETLSNEELQELREYEPEAYIKHMERKSKIESALKQAQTSKSPEFDVEKERQKLWSANPQWLDNGKPTESFNKDMKLMNKYAQQVGISDTTNFNAAMFQMLLDGAKYQDSKTKTDVLKKKVRKAPVTTKPRQSVSSKTSEYDKALSEFRKNPTEQNAIKLRKIKRNLGN